MLVHSHRNTMATQPHEASGRLRDPAEVKVEIANRQQAILNLAAEMRPLELTDPMWTAKMEVVNRHTSIIAVLRWVLGEDLLWE